MLNLHGPSMSVDTMCSSSLTAIHLACQDLKHYKTDLAIAGGANVTIHPNKYLMLSATQFISPKGHCESFGEGGEGYIPGEGVGAVLLKRLQDAIDDEDPIYGVILGSAINHGGKTNGYTVPNLKAQRSAIDVALAESQVDPRSISYVEAHGTGTKLGDPIEIAGLSQAFGRFTQDTGFCQIGSAKSNIGHCEGAAGIAGLTKVLLQMKHQKIVPSLHSAILNPHIDFASTPFVVNQTLKTWQRPVVAGREHPLIAGISSFGAGGSNAHMIISEYRQEKAAPVTVAARPVIVPLSAKTPTQLVEAARNLLAFIKENEGTAALDLRNLAYTLQTGREAMEERLGLVVSSISQLTEKLQAYIAGRQDVEDVYQGRIKDTKDALSGLIGDKEFQDAIEKWIGPEKLFKLVDLWVKGFQFDWNKLYGEEKPRRISLPTYPFVK
ncbi:beta-ketoacyl synthase N-terminal-like domain-containing protein, partial [Serratia proteamaculans]